MPGSATPSPVCRTKDTHQWLSRQGAAPEYHCRNPRTSNKSPNRDVYDLHLALPPM